MGRVKKHVLSSRFQTHSQFKKKKFQFLFSFLFPGLKYPIRAIHEATVNPVAPSKDDVGKSPDNWKVKMLYDGECPLCMREVSEVIFFGVWI